MQPHLTISPSRNILKRQTLTIKGHRTKSSRASWSSFHGSVAFALLLFFFYTIQTPCARSASPGDSTAPLEEMSSGPISQHALPTSESISMPTEPPSVLTGPPDPASTSSSSSHTSSETQSPYQQSTQPSNPPASPTSECTLSSLEAGPSLKSPSQTSASINATPFDIPSS